MSRILGILIIVAVISFAAFAASCQTGKSLNTGTKDESVADVKRQIWERTPRNRTVNLDKTKDFPLQKHVSIGYPSSFVLSNDGIIYLNDNTYGKIFKLPVDLSSIVEFGPVRLSRPTVIKEDGNYLFVSDENGINLFNPAGQAVKTVKPFLRIEDFDILDGDSYVVSLADAKLDIGPNSVAILNSSGKRLDSLVDSADGRSPSYPDIENKAFVEVYDGKLYVCYKYDPVCEIYELRTKERIASFKINDVIFPALVELKKDTAFVNPEPGKFKIPKFIVGFRIHKDKIFVLLHTPSPEVVEFSLDGKEINRHISSETQVLDYFGFDIRLVNDTKQFFVGTIDFSSNPSLVVYEEKLLQ